MARGAWDRTAALMFTLAATSFGGAKKGLTADKLNPYRGGRKGSMAGFFTDLRAMKRAQDQQQAQANGEPHGG